MQTKGDLVPTVPVAEMCHACGATTNIKFCAGCFSVMFCSDTCTKAAWPAHKETCKSVQKLKLSYREKV